MERAAYGAIMVSLVSWALSRSQHNAVQPRDTDGGPDAEATATSLPDADPDEPEVPDTPSVPDTPTISDAVEFDKSVTAARRRVVVKVLVSLLVAGMIAVLFQGVYNYRVLTSLDNPLAALRMGAGIPSGAATEIVLTLLTVVAALSIALATGTAKRENVEVAEFAAISVWAQYTAVASILMSILAMGTSMTQAFAAADDRHPVLVLALMLASGTAIFLSAAVTTWVGAKAQTEWDLRRRFAHLDERLSRTLFADHTESPDALRRTYTLFVLVAAITTTMLTLAPFVILDLVVPRDYTWAIGVLGVLLLAVAATWGTVVATLSRWRAGAEPSVLDRVYAPLPRLMWNVVMASVVAVFLLEPSPDAVRVAVVTLWVGAVLVPSNLLLLARKAGRGPATFAVRQHATWLRKERDEVGRRLAPRPSAGSPAVT